MFDAEDGHRLWTYYAHALDQGPAVIDSVGDAIFAGATARLSDVSQYAGSMLNWNYTCVRLGTSTPPRFRLFFGENAREGTIDLRISYLSGSLPLTADSHLIGRDVTGTMLIDELNATVDSDMFTLARETADYIEFTGQTGVTTDVAGIWEYGDYSRRDLIVQPRARRLDTHGREVFTGEFNSFEDREDVSKDGMLDVAIRVNDEVYLSNFGNSAYIAAEYYGVSPYVGLGTKVRVYAAEPNNIDSGDFALAVGDTTAFAVTAPLSWNAAATEVTDAIDAAWPHPGSPLTFANIAGGPLPGTPITFDITNKDQIPSAREFFLDSTSHVGTGGIWRYTTAGQDGVILTDSRGRFFQSIDVGDVTGSVYALGSNDEYEAAVFGFRYYNTDVLYKYSSGGALQWRVGLEGSLLSYSEPTMTIGQSRVRCGGGYVYACVAGPSVYVFNDSDGTLVIAEPWSGPTITALAVTPDESGVIVGIDDIEGRLQLWSAGMAALLKEDTIYPKIFVDDEPIPGSIIDAYPDADGEHVYVITRFNGLYKLKWTTSGFDVVWNGTLKGIGEDRFLYCYYRDGRVFVTTQRVLQLS